MLLIFRLHSETSLSSDQTALAGLVDGSFTDAKAVYPIITTAAETEPVTSKTKKTKETTTAPEEEGPILSGTLQLSDPD